MFEFLICLQILAISLHFFCYVFVCDLVIVCFMCSWLFLDVTICTSMGVLMSLFFIFVLTFDMMIAFVMVYISFSL